MTNRPRVLEELGAELDRAAQRRLRGGRARRARRAATARFPGVSGAVTALALASSIAVAVLAIALLGHGHRRSAGTGGGPLPTPPSVAIAPHLSRAQQKRIDAAWHATVARDRACYGFAGPRLTDGSPSRALTALLGVLRRPATPVGKLPRPISHGRQAFNRAVEVYINQARRARSAFGATFYVIPAGNVTGQRGVPGRCGPEQVAALQRQLSRVRAAQRTPTLKAQSRYLAYQRYQAQHPEGICATWVTPRTTQLSDGATVGCVTIAEFERWGIFADASAGLRRGAAFWTVVPDAVASVTLGFSTSGGPRATVTARPVDNVVVAIMPHGRNYPLAITLRSADGHIVRRYAVRPQTQPTLCGVGC